MNGHSHAINVLNDFTGAPILNAIISAILVKNVRNLILKLRFKFSLYLSFQHISVNIVTKDFDNVPN